MPEIGDIVRASDLEANKPQLSIGTVTTAGPQGPSGTYTGPLKPTSSYWQVTTRSLPSGGTWAYWQFHYSSDYQFLYHDVYSGIQAGGTAIGSSYNILLCWRIQ